MRYYILFFRRPSEPCIAEEEEDNFEIKHFRIDSENSSNPDPDPDNLDLEDDDIDNSEMNEFLKKVRSHGSFKFVLGDDSPHSTSKNPLHRVANTH